MTWGTENLHRYIASELLYLSCSDAPTRILMFASRLSRRTLPNVDYADIENKDQVLEANINKNGGICIVWS